MRFRIYEDPRRLQRIPNFQVNVKCLFPTGQNSDVKMKMSVDSMTQCLVGWASLNSKL